MCAHSGAKMNLKKKQLFIFHLVLIRFSLLLCGQKTASLVNTEGFKKNLDRGHESDMMENQWLQLINPRPWPHNVRELEILLSWFMGSSE